MTATGMRHPGHLVTTLTISNAHVTCHNVPGAGDCRPRVIGRYSHQQLLPTVFPIAGRIRNPSLVKPLSDWIDDVRLTSGGPASSHKAILFNHAKRHTRLSWDFIHDVGYIVGTQYYKLHSIVMAQQIGPAGCRDDLEQDLDEST